MHINIHAYIYAPPIYIYIYIYIHIHRYYNYLAYNVLTYICSLCIELSVTQDRL